MKAWHVFAGDPLDGSLLIFAEKASRARTLGLNAGLWDFGTYIDTRARRAPQWDKYATRSLQSMRWIWRQRIIETNEDLPKDAPPFYNDEALK